jgi:photosystem II stability/assembly factor-like uncharacterized protein
MQINKFSIRFFGISIILFLFAFVCEGQVWYKANNPFGGRVLEMHETSDSVLLCGTSSGLFKSIDNGENWQSISGNFIGFPVSAINSTPSGMYIAAFSGVFLRRSFDGGQTWDTIPSQNWTSIGKIVVNSSGQIFLNTNNSVWRSSDNGNNWTQLTIDVNVTSLNELDISPDGELFAGSYKKKIYRSSDNGDNWTEIFTANNNIRTIGFDGDSIIYAGTSFSGLYKSTDNGDNWSLLPALPGTNGVLDINVNSSGDVFTAQFEDGILKSIDGGISWQDISSNIVDPSVRKVFINSSDELFVGTDAAGVQKYDGSSWSPKNQGLAAITVNRFISIDSVLYACTGIGIFISDDGGMSWQQSIKGMDETEIYAVANAPNGDLYAGGDMLYYTQDGVNWINISQGFPNSEVTATDIFIEPNGRVIIATDDYGIRYTDNNGQSWTNANSGLQDVTMAFIRKSPQGFFTADGINLYRSNDLTGSWTIINNGLTDTDIAEFAVGNNTLFAVTYSDGLFKSTDNGNNWSSVLSQDVDYVAINGNEVYASSALILTGGVFFSGDNGDNWNNIGNGLPQIDVDQVVYLQGFGLYADVDPFGLYTLDFSVVGIEEKFNKAKLYCFPNPFNASTTLELEVEENTKGSINIYSLQGQIVYHSAILNLTKGIHRLQIGKDLPHGGYIVAFVTGNSLGTIHLIKTQ